MTRNRLMYWPGDSVPPAVLGRTSPIGDEVGGQDPDRPVPPGQLGHQEVRRPLVVLEGLPGEPLGEPVEPPADGQAADDRAEVRPALRQVPLGGPDVGMEPDGREVDVVGRAPGVDPDRHHPVADQPLGRRSATISADSVRSGRLGRTIVSWNGLATGSAPAPAPRTGSGAGRRRPGAGSARARGC